jgi:hypothetical protein
MNKSDWVWMPHHGHLIVGSSCRFHLNTYVGDFVVSTVGEWWPERPVREIHAQVHKEEWLKENFTRRGDDFDFAYMKEFGFMEIGAGRMYETMTFIAKKDEEAKHQCCPYTAADWGGVSGGSDGYNDPADAMRGHYQMCLDWSKKTLADLPKDE